MLFWEVPVPKTETFEENGLQEPIIKAFSIDKTKEGMN